MKLDLNQPLELIVGITITIFLLTYLTFSLIVIRQVQLLNKTLLTGLSPTLRTFAYGHAALALVLFVWALSRF